MLPSGTEVTLVGRQRGKVLDMAEPWARAKLGKPLPGYLDHANAAPNADFSLHSFQGIAIFALIAYIGIWLLLGRAVRGSCRWGLAAGGILLLLVSFCAAVLS